jgi:hypothetical protein
MKVISGSEMMTIDISIDAEERTAEMRKLRNSMQRRCE